MNSQFIKAGVLIYQDNKFLLVQEKAKRAYGLWNFPSGKVENGLSIKQTAIKEAKEETGFDVVLKREIAVLNNTFPDTKELHVYLGEVIGGFLVIPEDEILDAKWFLFEDIQQVKDMLVGEWVIQACGRILTI